ncbi:MAG: TonB-dependent receptor [Rikenellaceae bacterium]
MKHLFRFLVVILLIQYNATAFAQSGQEVKGSVVDPSGQPIIGANVIEKDNPMNGVATDIDGNFKMSLTCDNSTLVVSYLGYAEQELAVGTRTLFDVTLIEDTNSFEEVVVVGYGVQKKKLITGATAQVSAEDINEMGTNGTMTGLQSKITGVSISAANGQPGESEEIVIRGVGTIGDSSPLYVIDGVAGVSMDMINPSDIESIDILKDAASAAIYGSRAANGVVLVTTKKGKSDHFEMRYDGYYAIQNAANVVQSLNAKEYMEIMDETQGYISGAGYDWENLLPSSMYSSIMDGSWSGTNWIEEMMNPNASKQSHAITMSGGNERTTFSAGYSYLEQEGVFGAPCEPNYMRHNARLNMDNIMYKVGDLDVVKFGATMMFAYSEKSGISSTTQYDNNIKDAMIACPLMPVYNSDGEFYDMTDRANDGWNVYPNLENPIGVMVDTNQELTTYYRFFTNTYLEVQPIKNLKLRSAFGYKLNANHSRDFVPVYDYGATTSNAAELVTQGSTFSAGWTLDNTASYKFSIHNDHNFDIVLGQSIEKSGIGVSMEASNTNLTLDNVFEYAFLTNTSGVDSSYTSVSGSPAVNSMIASAFGRVNYNYKETYMITAMMRGDGSSKFAEGYRWGYFPSVSAGWVLSNEKFLSSSSVVDFLKLRVSWGQNGNCSISNFAYTASISFPTAGSYYFGNDINTATQGAYAMSLANEDVTWETSEQLDFGIDARFFHSRLGLTFDYYNKETRDWLVAVPVLSSYGANAAYDNAGDIRNRGVELGLSWRDRKGDFSYSVSLNGTYNKNEVTRIDNGNGYINGSTNVHQSSSSEFMYRAEEGMPIGYFYGYKTLGVFQNEEQVNNTVAKLDYSTVGDLIYEDLNGDGSITSDDRTMIGNPTPDFIMGLNISLAYKGFDLSIVANGEFGQQVFQNYRTSGNTNIMANYTKNIAENRWHGEGTSNTIPCLAHDYNWDLVSDMFIQDADFVKIQNITLGYDVNRIWKSSPLSRFRVYVSLQNYITITGYDGFDPDVNYQGPDGWSSGIDFGNYPTAKMCVFGTNITF